MERAHWSNSPAPVTESFTDESNSGESSSLALENFKDDLIHTANNATTDECTGWTNEKHNTFLDCLETSFVKQLHRSMVLRAGCVELNRSSRTLSKKLSSNNDKATKQFTAWRDGCWKINIESDQPALLVRQGDEYHHVTDLQLCSRIYTEEKQRREKMTSSYGLEERSDLPLPIPAELQKPVSRIAEGSGQNFADEDSEKNSRSEKLKTAMMDTADGQIVPTGKFESPGVANSLFQIKEEVNLEC
ncbi:cold-regulated protein 28-like [Lycium barbarum]|uniref:cold-regulated protein 28-like n=1 Tax=Lycium barbarum TaxID=112863 RepID=UPI00293F6ED1|nr:cold-regulated protein 28-like [Lycium barbarum]